MISESLCREQNQIIESKSKKIVVYAGPGCGKTYTLVKKIVTDMQNETTCYKGIIAISFTKKSAIELKEKIMLEAIDVSKVNATTIDSFVISFLRMFSKHYFYENENFKNLDFTIRLGDSDTENYFNNINPDSRDVAQMYSTWCSYFYSGEIRISAAMYIMACEYLKDGFIVSVIKAQYHTIYIDEAQDLNYYQYKFFEKMIDICNLNALFVGDINQCIYQFRGAKPKLFENLGTKGFDVYHITHSARCHPHILNFASHYLFGDKIEFLKTENIQINEKLDIDIINSDETCLFLASDAKQCNEIMERLSNTNVSKVIYVTPIYEVFEFDYDIQVIIESILYYYVNKKFSNHNVNLSVYRNLVLEETDNQIDLYEKKMEDIDIVIDSILDYKSSFSFLERLGHESILYYYNLDLTYNKVMTIHASKGLEADNVFVKLDKNFLSSKVEQRNKYYVAFTRAKKKLFLSTAENRNENYVRKILN